MKKVLVCALAALFLMASCLTAFASTPTYVTTTTYVMTDAGEKLQVNTNVSGADEGTMLTYLAYTGVEANDNSIVYIDQQTADSNKTASFGYTTAKGNLTGVTVKYGSSVSDTATDGNYNVRTVTVSYREVPAVTLTLPTEASETVTTGIKTGITVNEYESWSATIDGVADTNSIATVDEATGEIIIYDNKALSDGAAIVVETVDPIVIPVPEPDTGLVETGSFTGYESGEPVEKMTMFGYATGATLEDNWGGIIVGTDYNAVDEYEIGDDVEGVNEYRALYKNSEGAFAVQLVNKSGNSEFIKDGTTWYGKIYVGNEGGYGYSDVKEISVSDQAGY